MKKNIAQKWVKALRSGKYKQGADALYANGKHCCLGVLCAISPWKNNYTKMKSCGGDYMNSVLPEKVMEWSDMYDKDGGSRSCRFQTNLTSMNDDGKSFEYIANYIEENYKDL